MNCLEFRRVVGAEPGAADEALAGHRGACPACARFQDEMRALDALLLRALQVGPPARERPPAVRPRGSRRTWLALAASLVAGLALGLTLWLSQPTPTLASEVLEHLHHEPFALHARTAVDPDDIDRVLGPAGARLRPGLGEVTFSERCFIEGRVIPHLVVQTESGPVTVLLLSHRRVDGPVRFEDPKYAGVVLPAPRGSMAIVGEGHPALDEVARQVSLAIEWDG